MASFDPSQDTEGMWSPVPSLPPEEWAAVTRTVASITSQRILSYVWQGPRVRVKTGHYTSPGQGMGLVVVLDRSSGQWRVEGVEAWDTTAAHESPAAAPRKRTRRIA